MALSCFGEIRNTVTYMNCCTSRLHLWAVLFVCFLGFSARQAPAQASSTASRTEGVSVFGGVVIANPKFGPEHADGGQLGFDLTRYFARLPLQVSLEGRANVYGDAYVKEHSYLFGARAEYTIHGFVSPYADFLVGPGTVHYPMFPTYPYDNSVVYNFGGGFDIGHVHNFTLMLDVQQQLWNTQTYIFNPVIGTIGLRYDIPFRHQAPAY